MIGTNLKQPQTIYTIASKSSFSLGFPELWSYRELFIFFTWRDIKVKYKQTALGVIWAFLQPLAMMAVFTVIFQRGLNLKSDGLPYPIFAFAGLIIWNIFSSGVSNSANSMITNANIIKKIYFPRLIIPMSAVLTSLFDCCIALVLFVIILVYYSQPVNLFFLTSCLILSILLTVLVTFGMGTMLAAWNVKYRDFQYALPFVLQFLLFVNPVIYSSSTVSHSWLSSILALNPLAGAINLLRTGITGTNIDWGALILHFFIAMILCLVGLYSFRRTERFFADLT